MKRILIMDWDPHGEKYYYFFLFREDTYVQVWDHSEKGDESVPSGIKNPDIHTYDILVFPKPYCLTEWALNYLCKEKYKGVLVVEKLLAKTEEEIHRIMERLTDIQLYVFHSRLYAPSFTVFPDGAENKVEWPYYGVMDPMYNIVPNYLDEVFEKRQVFPQLKNSSLEGDKIIFDFYGTGSLTIYPDSGKIERVKLNEAEVEWPNYFLSMKKFFDDLEEGRISRRENLDYEIRMVKEVESIRSFKEGERA